MSEIRKEVKLLKCNICGFTAKEYAAFIIFDREGTLCELPHGANDKHICLACAQRIQEHMRNVENETSPMGKKPYEPPGLTR